MSQIDLESRLAPDLRRLARLRGWRLVVLFGSMARDGMGRDLDLAVLPASATPLLPIRRRTHPERAPLVPDTDQCTSTPTSI